MRSIRIENTLIRALQMNTRKRFAIVFWVPCFVRFDFSSHKLKCVLYTNGKFALAPHTQTLVHRAQRGANSRGKSNANCIVNTNKNRGKQNAKKYTKWNKKSDGNSYTKKYEAKQFRFENVLFGSKG